MREAGLEAYHDKGDEFLCRDKSVEDLRSKLESARAMLRDRRIVVQRSDGSTLKITGADFSYGVGKDLDEAELALKSHKGERERAGELARGQLRGITVRIDNATILISTVGTPFSESIDLDLP